LSHTLSGAWIAAAFFVMSVAAWYLIKNKHFDFAKASMKIAIAVAVFATLFQLFTGHRSADGVTENQPAKLAAFEGHYKTGPADMYLFGWVDNDKEEVTGLAIPGFLSFLVHFDTEKPVTGLDKFPIDERPPVNTVFQLYHLMVAIGMTLILLSILSVFFWWRGTLWNKKWYLKILVMTVLLPQIANQVGWAAAEIGRQPWIVYGLLKTKDGLSKSVDASQILFSLIFFTLIYILLFFLFLFLLDRKIKHGPELTGTMDIEYTDKKSIFSK
jgi:cytochrome d ubiquinol oxidase subunit I